MILLVTGMFFQIVRFLLRIKRRFSE